MVNSVCSVAERPSLRAEIAELGDESWPSFLLENDIRKFNEIFQLFPEDQLVLLADDGRTLRGCILSIPWRWSGVDSELPETIDEITWSSVQSPPRRGEAGVVQCALSAMVSRKYRGQGVSGELLGALGTHARALGRGQLVAPVRPSKKSAHPETPMSDYLEWRREDGSHFDPWIRTHERGGARIGPICSCSVTVEGTLEEWEEWTGVRLDPGSNVVEGALTRVEADHENDVARYVEPNVWMIRDTGL